MERATAAYPFPSISSPSHSPVPPQAVSGQRSPGNECFSCKRLGHWARDCPNKTPKKSAPASPSSSDNSMKHGSVSPMVRCPCGRGFCLIRESHTTANPGRMFYTCPVGKGKWCGFFCWYDELSSITVRTPQCPCGAGICSVNKASSPGPNGEKWYFACRIKENYGACEFSQWAASEPCTTNKRDGCSKGLSAVQSIHNVANNDLDKKEMVLESNLDLPLPQNAENSPDLPIVTEQSQQDDIPNVDIVRQDVASDPMTENLIQVFQPMARFQSPCLEESWRNIYVAGNTKTEDLIYQSLGCHVYGWLGRLAFPPSQCLKDPPSVPIFVCVFPSLSPVTISEDVDMSKTNGSLLSPHTALNAETNLPPLETPRQDAGLSGVVNFLEPSEHKDSSGIMQQSNVSSKSIVKTFGQALFNILESMNPLDPEGMLKVSEPTFIAFQKLSIKCCPFVEGVKKYIHNVSMLSSIEGSIHEGPSSQELVKLHKSEKNQFDNVSRLHTEADDAYTASNNHLKSLKQEFTRLKGELVELEQQLVDWEAKTSLLKARFDEVSEDMSKSKTSMDAASARMMSVFELEQQRESVCDAARVALENARAWLQEM